jgi:glycosyltransferase involved in cell wall biosynthesis
MPRVSVVIPAYNAEAYLDETLASVREQSYDDWEAVVADDGSSDRTAEIAESFGDRVTVVRGASNEGPAAARNRALAAASGELVAFLDADDLWAAGYLSRMTQLYDDERRGEKVGIVACDARVLGAGGFLAETYLQLMRAPREVTVASMLVSNTIFVSGAVVPRAVVDEAGGFCAELFGTEDYDLWLRILELGHRAVTTREALSIYRLRGGSVSTSSTRMAQSFQLTYKRALERGRLTPREQRIARRQLRLQRALEQAVTLVSARSWARLALSLPLLIRVAAENPDRWPAAARLVTGRASPLSQIAKS